MTTIWMLLKGGALVPPFLFGQLWMPLEFLSKHTQDVWMLIIFGNQVLNYYSIWKGQKTVEIILQTQVRQHELAHGHAMRIGELEARVAAQDSTLLAFQDIIMGLVPKMPTPEQTPTPTPSPNQFHADWFQPQDRKLRENFFPDEDKS